MQAQRNDQPSDSMSSQESLFASPPYRMSAESVNAAEFSTADPNLNTTDEQAWSVPFISQHDQAPDNVTLSKDSTKLALAEKSRGSSHVPVGVSLEASRCTPLEIACFEGSTRDELVDIINRALLPQGCKVIISTGVKGREGISDLFLFLFFVYILDLILFH
jgi:hypothetical protein